MPDNIQIPIVEVEIPEKQELLRSDSVKRLPQSKQVPIIYRSQFFDTNITDTNLVIRALRDDFQALYERIYAEANGDFNSITDILNQNITALLQIKTILQDFETRIEALEALHP